MRANSCTVPTDPGWPIALFAFHGILEYGYLDSTIGTINNAVVDKDSLKTIQEFRVKQFTDSNGTLRQFRGASGWYFQAAGSTAETRINTSNQDERDPANRAGWGNIVTEWSGGVNVKPVASLFMGLTMFGGYYYGERDPYINGNIDTGPGPIRLTYLYGDSFSYNNCQMQFELQSVCKARLKGTTQAIPDWAASGSLLSDSDASDTSIVPGSDNFIVLDGLRAIRIRPLGWLAHMADHAMKPSDTFTNFAFPAGMQMVWRENATAFAFDSAGNPLGNFTPQYAMVSGSPVYGYSLEFTGFHHYNFGQWSDTNLGAPDRYHLKMRAKVWYKVSGVMPAKPDPYKVLIGSTYTPPDEVVEVQATQRQTVHEPPTGAPFFTPASYAKNAGFVLTFAQTVEKIAYLHITIHYGDQIIGSQFWGGNNSANALGFPLAENINNATLFQKTANTDSITDDFSASLVAMPFGRTVDSPLPKVYLAVKTITGTRFRAVTFQIYWPSPMPGGATYAINYGDGSTATGLTTLTPSHTYDTEDTGDQFTATLTATWAGGSFTHKTYLTV